MKSNLALVALVLFPLAASACATTAASTQNWGDPNAQGAWARYGRVEHIRETLQYQQGDPGSGAVAGALIGGILGTALGGRGIGTFFGAAEGAMIGADASQGGREGRRFEVFVRFDEGDVRTFVYQDYLPFRTGEYVVWTAEGLAPRQDDWQQPTFLGLFANSREYLRTAFPDTTGIKPRAGLDLAMRDGFELVGMGRALVHDPTLPKKLQRSEVDVSACVPCNKCIAEMDRGGVRCTRVG